MMLRSLLPLLLLSPAHAQVAGGLETFTDEDNGISWAFFDEGDETGQTYQALWAVSDTGEGDIYAFFSGASVISLFADNLSSLDANGEPFFVGDYAAAGIDAISCDIFIEDAASLDGFEFILIANGTTYYSIYFDDIESGTFSYRASLSESPWFVVDTANNEFVEAPLTPAVLANVTTVGLNFIPRSADATDRIVAIDNFTILPDLTPPTLTINDPIGSVSFFRKQGVNYNLEVSRNLRPTSWSGLDGDTSAIRGEGLYERSFTTRPKFFFRVTTSLVETTAP